jgi:hypothetical protein
MNECEKFEREKKVYLYVNQFFQCAMRQRETNDSSKNPSGVSAKDLPSSFSSTMFAIINQKQQTMS